MNEVLKDKDEKILNPKIPRYERLKYTLSNVKTETGRLVLYNDKKYKEYVRLYEIPMSGIANVTVNHGLSDFLLTEIAGIEYNPNSKSQFPLPSYRPTYPKNGMGLYVSATQIVIETNTEAPDRSGHIALVSLFFIELNNPIS